MMRKKHIRLPGVRRSIEELEQSGLTNHTAQTSTEEAKLKQEDLNRRVAPLRTSLKAALISQRDADSAVRSQKTAGKRV
jgi:regulator of sirC expression with transglutaminase-like and TPR domain